MATKKIQGQQQINFETPPPRVIPIKYDEERALAARRRRNKRLGSLVLNNRNSGFLKIDKGLWIPGSKGEVTVAVQSPDLTINKSRLNTYERTHHKGYAKKAANETRAKIESYYDDAAEQRWKLSRALLHYPARAYTEYTLTHSELAFEAIVRYIQDLNSFIDRDWPQKRWSKYRDNQTRASREVGSLYIDDLLDIYDEAMWSVRSRMRFWHDRGMNANEPPVPPPVPFNTIDPTEHETYEE